MRGLGITDWGDSDFRPHFVRHRRYAALPPAEAVQQTDRRGDGEVNDSHWTKPKKQNIFIMMIHFYFNYFWFCNNSAFFSMEITQRSRQGSNSPIGTRRTAKDLSENKLMSNSDLFNMYLELTENKNLINNKFSLTSKETKKERSLNIINFSNYAKLVTEDIKEVNKENEKDVDVDIDCKSQPEVNHLSFGKSNCNLTDDDTSPKNTKNFKKFFEKK